jgi:NADPH:quinone reductase-like Zn-dependent oxidoreductase
MAQSLLYRSLSNTTTQITTLIRLEQLPLKCTSKSRQSKKTAKMTTWESRAWTYTGGGYPAGLKSTVVDVPRGCELKGLWSTPHMLVNIQACALNPVDIQMINLLSSLIPLKSYQTEKGVACDFSATVSAGGRTGFMKGDEIFGMTLKPYKYGGGALSEMAELDMSNTVAVKKPAEWSWQQAAAIPLVWLTARTCIANVEDYVEQAPGKRLAVLGGSSATGIYTIMLAKKRGWKVITTSSAKNKDFVTSTLGADQHVDYTSVSSVRSAIQAFEPDAVVDCVGGTECVGLPSSKRYITIGKSSFPLRTIATTTAPMAGVSTSTRRAPSTKPSPTRTISADIATKPLEPNPLSRTTNTNSLNQLSRRQDRPHADGWPGHVLQPVVLAHSFPVGTLGTRTARTWRELRCGDSGHEEGMVGRGQGDAGARADLHRQRVCL